MNVSSPDRCLIFKRVTQGLRSVKITLLSNIEIHMKYVLLVGDSRTRSLANTMTVNEGFCFYVETIPGARLRDIFGRSLQLLEKSLYDILLVHGGICDLVNRDEYRYFSISSDNSEKHLSDIREECEEFRAIMHTRYPTVKLIFNTVIGIDLAVYNGLEIAYKEPVPKSTRSSTSGETQMGGKIYKADGAALTKKELMVSPELGVAKKNHDKNQYRLNDLVIYYNELMVSINKQAGYKTPRTADLVHKNRSTKKVKRFQHAYRYLKDGCHYHPILASDISKKLVTYVKDLLER